MFARGHSWEAILVRSSDAGEMSLLHMQIQMHFSKLGRATVRKTAQEDHASGEQCMHEAVCVGTSSDTSTSKA